MADQTPGSRPGGQNPGDPREIRPDPFFENMGLDPNQPMSAVVCFSGILARSQREGYWLLYLRLDMSEYLDIRGEDIISSQPLPADQSPFGSLGGTLVCVKQGTQIQHVQTSSRQFQAGAQPTSEFDLNIQLGAGPAFGAQAALPNTQFGTTCDTCRTQCGGTCPGDTCFTCGATCVTCHTRCGTCVTCGQTCGQTCQTCQTCVTCGQTCQTCQTQCATCGGQTCQTCVTCFQTCQTCHTRCGTCVTCGQTCRTCDTCPGDTCGRTCASCCGPGCQGTTTCPF